MTLVYSLTTLGLGDLALRLEDGACASKSGLRASQRGRSEIGWDRQRTDANGTEIDREKTYSLKVTAVVSTSGGIGNSLQNTAGTTDLGEGGVVLGLERLVGVYKRLPKHQNQGRRGKTDTAPFVTELTALADGEDNTIALGRGVDTDVLHKKVNEVSEERLS